MCSPHGKAKHTQDDEVYFCQSELLVSTLVLHENNNPDLFSRFSLRSNAALRNLHGEARRNGGDETREKWFKLPISPTTSTHRGWGE